MKLHLVYIKLEDFMIPCLNKKLFGFDCPGCGIQRSLVHLFQGEFIAAFKMYPAIYTLLFLGGFMVFKNKIKKNNSRKIILILAVINILIILSSYIIKMKSTFNN